MKSTEFSGFICDGCGRPFTIEQAEFKAVHVTGHISVNNDRVIFQGEGSDFHNKACFMRSLRDKFREEDYN